jgi:VWFA-related protein
VPELDRFLQGKDDQQPISGLRRCDPQRIRISIAAFQEIARRTLGLRGRKALIWVTEGVPGLLSEENAFDRERGLSGLCGMEPYDPDLIVLEEPANLRSSFRRSRSATPGDSSSGSVAGTVPTRGGTRDRELSEYDEFDLELRLLTQNNFAIYPVSAEGLQTVRLFGPEGMDTTAPLIHDPGAMTNRVLSAVHAVANGYAHQLMEELARLSGGRAYYDRNDLETGIRRALDDAKYGYELAYYPDHDRWNGDWRKIEVKVDRPGVTVVARGGYYAFPEPKLLPPKASKQLLEEIAASPLEDTEIPITVKLTPPSGVRSSVVEARVYLSAQNLFTNHFGDAWKSNFEVLFFQLTTRNKILDVSTENVNLELTQAKYREALKLGIDTLGTLQLKHGAALLYVIVHDKSTDAVGSVRIPLNQYADTLPAKRSL